MLVRTIFRFGGNPVQHWHGGEHLAALTFRVLRQRNRVAGVGAGIRDTKIFKEPVTTGVVGKQFPVIYRGLIATPTDESWLHAGNVVLVVGVDAVDIWTNLVAICERVDIDGDIGFARCGDGNCRRAD